MPKLESFISKLTNLQERASKKANRIIFEDRDFLESSIRERLSEGETSEGTEITNEVSTGPRDGAYSRRRAKERRSEGLQTDHVDLKETGRLYKSIKYKRTERGGEIEVSDDKSKVTKLEGFFGGPELLWGISDQDAQFVADRNAQQIADEIAKLIT